MPELCNLPSDIHPIVEGIEMSMKKTIKREREPLDLFMTSMSFSAVETHKSVRFLGNGGADLVSLGDRFRGRGDSKDSVRLGRVGRDRVQTRGCRNYSLTDRIHLYVLLSCQPQNEWAGTNVRDSASI
jgi:hypothetical protein